MLKRCDSTPLLSMKWNIFAYFHHHLTRDVSSGIMRTNSEVACLFSTMILSLFIEETNDDAKNGRIKSNVQQCSHSYMWDVLMIREGMIIIHLFIELSFAWFIWQYEANMIEMSHRLFMMFDFISINNLVPECCRKKIFFFILYCWWYKIVIQDFLINKKIKMKNNQRFSDFLKKLKKK